MKLRKAQIWQWAYFLKHRYVTWQRQHISSALTLSLLSAIVLSAFGLPLFQDRIEAYFTIQNRFEGVQSLFLALGSALLGAAAITSSLVLFAMQVNVERMPHGLFNRLSSDRQLLYMFGSTFLLAVGVIALSLIPSYDWIGAALFFSFWATTLILVLFLFGYRRALLLVNPIRQLELVVSGARDDMSSRVRRAIRFTPIFDYQNSLEGKKGRPQAQTHDLPRLAYFQSNPTWSDEGRRAVGYAISISRRYSEQVDHEVSFAALKAVVAINADYVRAKGKTFFAYNLMVDNPFVTDGFINNTLEHLRQNSRISLARGDEQQIEQTLQAMASLVQVYLSIDYGNQHASRTHAHLALGYLTNEIERIVPHNMPDVLMEALRLLGKCADWLLVTEGPKGLRGLIQKIGAISCAGITKEEYRPVTSTGVEQLARLSFNILRTDSHDVRIAAKEVREAVKLLARLLLTLPEEPMSNTHSACLGPYYSSTSTRALSFELEQLTNAIANADEGNDRARRLIGNFIEWANGIHETEKEILLEAINRRSSFTFDIIYWIKHLIGALLALSNAAACDSESRNKLRELAVRLSAVFFHIPTDEETVRFVENYRMTELLFESALDAQSRDCMEILNRFSDLLQFWMFKAGSYHTGWATLEMTICALVVLALHSGEQAVVELKTAITRHLASGELPDKSVRDIAASNLRERAESRSRIEYTYSDIERSLFEADQAKLRPLLEEIAEMISPRT